MFNNQVIFITGGTGSWGQELVFQILQGYTPAEIRIYSRGEEKQALMKHAFNNPKLKFIIGDVRDKDRLTDSMRGADYVFNLAALKHVPICEEHPWEAILTNIFGSKNLIDASIKNNVKHVFQVSTDKAVDPLNLYGVTKLCVEKLMIAANNLFGDTRFSCVRGGNVIGTSGSVIPLFQQQIIRMNQITLTHKDMTRFFITKQKVIGFLLKACEKSVGGEIFIPRMPSMRIIDLAEVMIKELGNKDTKIKDIGIRPGEKIHEVLVSKNEGGRVIDDGEFYIILPLINISFTREFYSRKQLTPIVEYNSKENTCLNRNQIREVLKQDGWLSRGSDKAGFIGKLSKEDLEKISSTGYWQR